MYCANCGNKVSDTDLYCANCGHKQEMKNSVSQRQNSSSSDNSSYKKVNHALNANVDFNSGSSNSASIESTTNIAKKGFPKSLILVFGIVIIAVAGLVIFMINNSSKPEDTAKTFFENVKSGNVEKAIDCMTPEIKNQWNLGMGLANVLGNQFGLSGSSSLLNSVIGLSDSNAYQNYDFKVQSAIYNGESNAKVPVDVYVNGKKQQTTTLDMRKIDNKWYISK